MSFTFLNRRVTTITTREEQAEKLLQDGSALNYEMIDYFKITLGELALVTKCYSACGFAGSRFFFDPKFADVVRLWMKVGDAYSELGFYHFITALGFTEARREIS